jgi:hypothetical protein
VALVSLTSCRKSNTGSASAPSHRAKIDACTLITKDEIQGSQGSPVKDEKGSEQADGDFRIAQCFCSAPLQREVPSKESAPRESRRFAAKQKAGNKIDALAGA